MQIRNHIRVWNSKLGAKHFAHGRAQWAAVFIGCLVLFPIAWLLLAPAVGWSAAAPGLQVGPFTNISGVNYFPLTVTNGTSTNIYQIDHRAQLNSNVPWVGSTTGIVGQTNFLIPMGPEYYMFYRAINGDDWDLDGIPNSRDANPFDTNIGVLTITILSP